MAAELFDTKLRAMRRDRAFRGGVETFLYERAFEDCVDRLGLIQHRFRSALVIGCPDPLWPERLASMVDRVQAIDPGARFAVAAGAMISNEEDITFEPGEFDLCLAIGTLDTVNDLPRALAVLRHSMAPDGLFLGALAGGNTLPQLRAAMHEADRVDGFAVPHAHPRIDGPTLGALLGGAGFINPVVDVDRVEVRYESLGRLVRDLRAMGVTNILNARSRRGLSRRAWGAAHHAFAAAGGGGRTAEIYEILHFAAWNPGSGLSRR
jgi:SAM-dependent methyltransferase